MTDNNAMREDTFLSIGVMLLVPIGGGAIVRSLIEGHFIATVVLSTILLTMCILVRSKISGSGADYYGRGTTEQ